MRLTTFPTGRGEVDELFARFFGDGQAPTGRTAPLFRTAGHDVPTDVFHSDGRLVIRMDLPGVRRDDVEITVQDNVLVIDGSRAFPYQGDEVRFLRRGTFYGEFTQRVTLGKGLKLDEIAARFEDGVLELTVPYAEEVKPRRIEIQSSNGIQSGGDVKELSS